MVRVGSECQSSRSTHAAVARPGFNVMQNSVGSELKGDSSDGYLMCCCGLETLEARMCIVRDEMKKWIGTFPTT